MMTTPGKMMTDSAGLAEYNAGQVEKALFCRAIVLPGVAVMRLLVIEDYDPLRKSLVKGLQEAGFAVDVTGDGRRRQERSCCRPSP